MRASDTVSRLGGDEFLLLIGDVGGPGGRDACRLYGEDAA